MADTTAGQVMALRKKTGLPMMECKEALTECKGDEAAAIEWLTKKHKGKMEARSDRETGEGRIGVYISPDGTTGGIIELRCETAPVAKNEMFIDLANKIAEQVAKGSEKNPSGESIGAALEAQVTEVYGKLRETMKIGACYKVTGDSLASYVHFDGKSGVLIGLKGKPADADVSKNLAMHATSLKPIAANREDVPDTEVAKVRELAVAQAKEEGKPEQIVDKIADGKVNAFYAEKVLIEQEHVRSDVYGKKKVKDVLAENGVTGVTEMVYLTVGA
ncbi:MAG TPA: translation elongation factor Ts [Phycisphaerae bacterium]|nr:translation elongation factor Ts [Phycisphaerales bacterium]HRX83866.1 translation elongation factor Ts [Phycisphaerae bacterium]